MRYYIRCPKVNHDWHDVKFPWNNPNYIEFADHIDPSLNGDDKSIDTAFGDRLWWWNAGYNAARYYNFDCRLQFKYDDMPECEVLRFPHTEFVDTEYFYSNIKEFEYVSVDDQSQMELTALRHLPIDPSNSLDKNIILPSKMSNHFNIEHMFSLIEFVHPELEECLSQYFSRFNVVHVRRYYGIEYEDESVFDELGEELKEKYINEVEPLKTPEPSPWSYYTNSHYFNALKDVDGPIYIATDLPREYYYDAWYKEYGDMLYDYDSVYAGIEDIFREFYSHRWINKNRHIMNRMIDWFAIAFADHLHIVRRSDYDIISAYSDTARLLRNVPCIIHEVEL